MAFVRLALLSVVSPCAAWVLYPGSKLEHTAAVNISNVLSQWLDGTHSDRGVLGPAVFRWAAEKSWKDKFGLGGGISWAIDPDFCDTMLPLFADAEDVIDTYDFVNCEALRSAISRAFDTWASNNKNLHFFDVTDLCNTTNRWKKQDAFCTSDKCWDCDLAEVIVGNYETIEEYDLSGARVIPLFTGHRPKGTNDDRLHGGTIAHMDLQFGRNICWYLDSTFCQNFYQAAKDGTNVVALMAGILGLMSFGAGCLLAYAIFEIIKKVLLVLFQHWIEDADEDGEIDMYDVFDVFKKFPHVLKNLICKCKVEPLHHGDHRSIEFLDAITTLLEAIADLQLCRASIVFFFLFFPTVFYYTVFYPCWSCVDFGASAVHEVGRILGFDSPDRYKDHNFQSDQSQYNCTTPFEGVTFHDNQDLIESIMHTHADRTEIKKCLSKDDLDGLNFLYPVCTRRLEEPACPASELNIGIVRLIQALIGVEFIPGLIILAAKFAAKILLRTGKIGHKAAQNAVRRLTVRQRHMSVIKQQATHRELLKEAKKSMKAPNNPTPATQPRAQDPYAEPDDPQMVT